MSIPRTDPFTGASRTWPAWENNAPVSGQQFTYAYDNIGNRLTAGSGGDVNGQNLRTNTYANNSLNEYTGIQTPGYVSIIGAALATNSVTVNGGAADRKAEYFHKEIAVANGTGPVWQNVTNTSGTFTSQGGLLVPASAQTLTYDADGNLTADGIWTYQWDGENRLISMAMTPSVQGIASSNVLRLDFTYDYLGRRVQKVVSVWNGTGFTPQSTSLFVYDGWNLLAVINTQATIQQSFMWGNDLSGTMDQAGGVGGLLLASISGTNTFSAYDGNGNITSLVNATDKSLAARYEYNPYGCLLRETGLLARQNPFRFATKFLDEESGLIYYGYRYSDPRCGRWINKDPSEEKGGFNLYLFVLNAVLNNFDTLGESVFRIDYHPGGIDIHDGDLTYGLDANGEAEGFTGYDRGGIHEGQGPAAEVAESIQENLCTSQKRLETLIAKCQMAEGLTKSEGSLARLTRIRASAASTIRSLTTMGGGAVLGAVAIYTAIGAGQACAANAVAYGNDIRNGNSAYADLDAIDIAVNIQDGCGNAFVTDFALSMLLTN
jgi:RHS repeat-associated protein